jgi:hypothetical protein
MDSTLLTTSTTQLKQQRLTISISQIAPLVGLDSYNNFPRIVCEIWRKYNPTDFKIVETKLKESGNLQLATSSEMNDIWEADEALGTNILQKVKEINSNKEKTSNDHDIDVIVSVLSLIKSMLYYFDIDRY